MTSVERRDARGRVLRRAAGPAGDPTTDRAAASALALEERGDPALEDVDGTTEGGQLARVGVLERNDRGLDVRLEEPTELGGQLAGVLSDSVLERPTHRLMG